MDEETWGDGHRISVTSTRARSLQLTCPGDTCSAMRGSRGGFPLGIGYTGHETGVDSNSPVREMGWEVRVTGRGADEVIGRLRLKTLSASKRLKGKAC